jgi:hypothetical protein
MFLSTQKNSCGLLVLHWGRAGSVVDGRTPGLCSGHTYLAGPIGCRCVRIVRL